MSRDSRSPKEPISLVTRSRRNMLDAVRQALSGASRSLGGLERCDATISPQIVHDGRTGQFQVILSVTKRVIPNSRPS